MRDVLTDTGVWATVIGTVLGTFVVFLAGVLWKYAGSVARNTQELARLATAIERQGRSHKKMRKRIRRLEERIGGDNAGRTY